ncbi:J-type chaperone [Pichia kluyveri]|uniref:J-type chaperone n=1 Tax=Pichia kluyveri TaxID=36015 RepID=A0AAV5R4V1_PICKL|nr:J-type chaperone [Pichia kluyveri]
MFRRLYSSKVVDYISLFPNSIKKNNAIDVFRLNTKNLRKEYRQLQSISHPDLNSNKDEQSSIINKAYKTLNDPLSRSQYILLKYSGIDLINDTIGKSMQFEDKEMLMEMMEIHEQLESIVNEDDVNKLKDENNLRINELINKLDECYEKNDWDLAAITTIRLKYAYNIKNALKEWEIGKPIALTH